MVKVARVPEPHPPPYYDLDGYYLSLASTGTAKEYEEGSWTPAIAFGGGTTGITYNVQIGTYTQIGNVVHAFGIILLTAKGSSTGQMTITGLPVAVVSSGGASVGYYAGFSGLSGTPLILVDNNAGGPRAWKPGAAAASALTHADVTDTMDLRFSLSYTV